MTLQREEADGRMARRTRVDRRPVPPHDNSSRIIGLAIVTVVTLGLMLGWFWASVGERGLLADEPSAPAPAPQAPAEPPPAGEGADASAQAPAAPQTPEAPISNQLRSRDWLLSPYALVNDDGQLLITGTLTNVSDNTASARVTVFVYAGGTPIASASGEVLEVESSGSAEIELPSGSPWVAGSKVLLVQAEPLPPS